jgi:hypothetical protein
MSLFHFHFHHGIGSIILVLFPNKAVEGEY